MRSGWGFPIRVWHHLKTINTTTEVRPLSKPRNPQLLPGCRSIGCPLLRVCVLCSMCVFCMLSPPFVLSYIWKSSLSESVKYTIDFLSIWTDNLPTCLVWDILERWIYSWQHDRACKACDAGGLLLLWDCSQWKAIFYDFFWKEKIAYFLIKSHIPRGITHTHTYAQ